MLDTQNCLQNHIKATEFPSQSAFYTYKGSTYKDLPFYNFWLKLYDKFCSPTQSSLSYTYSTKSGTVL